MTVSQFSGAFRFATVTAWRYSSKMAKPMRLWEMTNRAGISNNLELIYIKVKLPFDVHECKQFKSANLSHFILYSCEYVLRKNKAYCTFFIL